MWAYCVHTVENKTKQNEKPSDVSNDVCGCSECSPTQIMSNLIESGQNYFIFRFNPVQPLVAGTVKKSNEKKKEKVSTRMVTGIGPAS